jgi:hypothetical protein
MHVTSLYVCVGRWTIILILTHERHFLYCKTQVIATTYNFSVQVPVSPANFSKPIFKHTQPLQNPEYVVVVRVIVSHGAAVAVAAFTPRVVLWLSSCVWCCGGFRHARRGFAGAVVGLRGVAVAVAMPRAVSRLPLCRVVLSSRVQVLCCMS